MSEDTCQSEANLSTFERIQLMLDIRNPNVLKEYVPGLNFLESKLIIECNRPSSLCWFGVTFDHPSFPYVDDVVYQALFLSVVPVHFEVSKSNNSIFYDIKTFRKEEGLLGIECEMSNYLHEFDYRINTFLNKENYLLANYESVRSKGVSTESELFIDEQNIRSSYLDSSLIKRDFLQGLDLDFVKYSGKYIIEISSAINYQIELTQQISKNIAMEYKTCSKNLNDMTTEILINFFHKSTYSEDEQVKLCEWMQSSTEEKYDCLSLFFGEVEQHVIYEIHVS